MERNKDNNMTLINLTNQSYNINLSTPYQGSSTLYVLPFSAADYPDRIADEPEVKAKEDKKIFRIVRNSSDAKTDRTVPQMDEVKQSIFSKIKTK